MDRSTLAWYRHLSDLLGNRGLALDRWQATRKLVSVHILRPRLLHVVTRVAGRGGGVLVLFGLSGCDRSQVSLTIRSSRARFAASAERRKIVTLPWPRSGPA